jgi:hypothetical protein
MTIELRNEFTTLCFLLLSPFTIIGLNKIFSNIYIPLISCLFIGGLLLLNLFKEKDK